MMQRCRGDEGQRRKGKNGISRRKKILDIAFKLNILAKLTKEV